MELQDNMKRIFNILLLIIWLSTIFMFSSQKEEETKKTSDTFDVVINVVIKDERKKPSAKWFVRKLAHFTEYFILALLIINVIKDYRIINYKWLIFTMIMCTLYAISDEYHQSFVAGRQARILDVCIDSSGALLSTLIYIIFNKNKLKDRK
jgi:VanZ family protein